MEETDENIFITILLCPSLESRHLIREKHFEITKCGNDLEH